MAEKQDDTLILIALGEYPNPDTAVVGGRIDWPTVGRLIEAGLVQRDDGRVQTTLAGQERLRTACNAPKTWDEASVVPWARAEVRGRGLI